jgi:hypothetical protein
MIRADASPGVATAAASRRGVSNRLCSHDDGRDNDTSPIRREGDQRAEEQRGQAVLPAIRLLFGEVFHLARALLRADRQKVTDAHRQPSAARLAAPITSTAVCDSAPPVTPLTTARW